MKNIIKITLSTFIASVLLFSCSKDEYAIEEQNTFENIDNLSKDVTFKNSLEESIHVVTQIENLDKVETLLQKGELSEMELEELSRALGFKNLSAYKDFINKQALDLNQLNLKYDLNTLDQNTIQSAAIESFSEELATKNNCERIRRNCIINAAAAATVAHLGCGALDVTVVAGVVCHAAVVIAQAATSDNCNAAAEDCEQNSGS